MSALLNQQLIFGLLGGLGMFLFGMKTMSEGLQKIAGDKMRKIISALTDNRFIGALVGIAVTAIIQSSSAVTVMVVGFVNAGLLSLIQAIGVILGANIGTTITAQLIAFKITKFALPAIGLGAGLKLFSKNKKYTYTGEIILGLGLLFLGLLTMKHAFIPLKSNAEFRELFILVGDYKLLGVLIGALLTVLVQSSSATIGITLVLASSGLISFEASVALILGENIGTTITTNIAAIGTNLAAKRTAFSHLLFNVVGVLYMLLLMPVFMKIISMITPGDADFVIQTQAQANSYLAEIGDKPYIARHIANTHTAFNVINTILFLPFIGLLAKVSSLIVRGEDSLDVLQVKYIDDRVLNTPPVAIGQARRETRRMAQVTIEMVQETTLFLDDGDFSRIRALKKKEELVDVLQQEILSFLVKLSQKSISAQTSETLSSLMNIVNDLERIGDYCVNLWQLGIEKNQSKITFSNFGDNDLSGIAETTMEFLTFVIHAMESEDKTIGFKSIEYEDKIDAMEESLRSNHIQRLHTGECAVQPGLIFIDMLSLYEKIGDHTYKISRSLCGED
ncbi:phosphate:Na+ symporter [Desulfuromusa kysingii]|uniref:Phosphate:Na+ symporter n=1 Tax=Desulfuromusa kysingii TaxID=37625 RepID=A0A1H4BNW6_9BACT|nr:Na/Pi cotransporter family protein [Desulfuromusa kysingii]SEA49823.1 phosphate:Na+ symporter [Desulfuromusa kysingii]